MFARSRCSRNRRPAPLHRCDLGKPDDGLHSLHLAEKGPNAAEGVVTPVLQEAGGRRGNVPVIGVRPRSPLIQLPAKLVYCRGQLVLLLLGRDAGGVLKDERLLGGWRLPFPRLRNRRDELSPAAVLDDPQRWLAVRIEFPVARRTLVGGVEDRLVEELVRHRPEAGNEMPV